MDGSEPWSGLLEEGEKILWQGQPDTRVTWRDLVGPFTPFGIIFTGFSIFWIVMARSMTGGAGFPLTLFPLFGLPFFVIGLYLLAGHVFLDAYFRRHTFYTLTDRTAFIATSRFGTRRLSSHPIADMPFLELEDGAPGSVLFAERTATGTRHRAGRPMGKRTMSTSTTSRLGFRHIAEARQVYRMLRDARGALNFAQRRARDGA